MNMFNFSSHFWRFFDVSFDNFEKWTQCYEFCICFYNKISWTFKCIQKINEFIVKKKIFRLFISWTIFFLIVNFSGLLLCKIESLESSIWLIFAQI